MKNNKEDNDKDIWMWVSIALVTLLIIGLWLATYFILKDETERGTIGDMFGSVNALFSGLALAGIIFTILLQRKELQLQRKELRDTREEFKIQNETLRLQRFENTLFQMIGIHHEVIDKLTYSPPHYPGSGARKVYEKRDAISNAVIRLKADLDRALRDKSDYAGNKDRIEVTDIDEAYKFLQEGYYEFYFARYKQLLSHYYRNIYHIFKFIYTSNLIEQPNKKFYASIVRAQLSSDELFLILYNSLMPNLGKPNFLFLIRELDILQNFDFDLISDFKFHEEIYNQELEKAQPEFLTKPLTPPKQ